MTYEELRDKQQAEFNALPLFFAFSNEQFKREMEKRGLTENDTDKIYRFGYGGFYLRSDAQIIRDYMNTEDHELEELMKIPDFAIDAFVYEMRNHEYSINYFQGDFDVCSCFANKELEYDDVKDYTDYLTEMNRSEWIPFYKQARTKYYKLADENDWY